MRLFGFGLVDGIEIVNVEPDHVVLWVRKHTVSCFVIAIFTIIHAGLT